MSTNTFNTVASRSLENRLGAFERRYEKQNGYLPLVGLVPADSLQEYKELSRKHPIKYTTLFIPTTVDDAIVQSPNAGGGLDVALTPQMHNIMTVLDNLKDNISLLTVGVDAAKDEQEFYRVRDALKGVSDKVQVIFNDAEEMTAFYTHWGIADLPAGQRKGRNFWTGVGHSLASRPYNGIATHDSDIVARLNGTGIYDEDFALRMLFFADPLNPLLTKPVDFGKAYYDRLSVSFDEHDQKQYTLYGRLNRLLLPPMIGALMESPLADNADFRKYLLYLDQVKYQTSGEVTLSHKAARNIAIEAGYRQELGMLFSAFDLRDKGYVLRQFDLGLYDHRHQQLGVGAKPAGLQKMAVELWKAVLGHAYQLSSGIRDPNAVAYLEGFDTFLQGPAIDDIRHSFGPLGNNCVDGYLDATTASSSLGWSYDSKSERDLVGVLDGALVHARDELLPQIAGVLSKQKSRSLDIDASLPKWVDIHRDDMMALAGIVEKYCPAPSSSLSYLV